MGYLFTAAPGKCSHCHLPWMWGISSQPLLLTLDMGYIPWAAPAPHSCCYCTAYCECSKISTLSSLSGPCPGLPVHGHSGIPPQLQKQESVGRGEGCWRGWKGKIWVEGIGHSRNLILLAPSPSCSTRRPKEDRLFPSKGLSASSVNAQSRKLHFLCN